MQKERTVPNEKSGKKEWRGHKKKGGVKTRDSRMIPRRGEKKVNMKTLQKHRRQDLKKS